MSSFVPQSRPKRLFRMRDGLRKTHRSRTSRDFRFGLEPLEDRLVLSNYAVTNINYNGSGSLGAAIASAISSDDSHAQIDFSLPDNSTISLSTTYGPTAYVISGNGVNITIDGSSAPGLTIDGSGATRVFVVTSPASLTLKDLTVSGGVAQGGAGGTGGFLSGGDGGGAGLGGAVYDDGASFTAEGVTFTQNVAGGGDGGVPGGGFGNSGSGGAGGFGGGGGGGPRGSGNGHTGLGGLGGFGGGSGGAGGAEFPGGGGGAGGFGGGGGGDGGPISGGGGGAGLGGGIFSNGGSLTLVNDTFTGNAAEGGAVYYGPPPEGGFPGGGFGGAVFAVNGSLNATFVTFSGNTAVGGNDGIDNSDNYNNYFYGGGTDVYVLTDLTDSGVHGGGTFDGTFVDDILGQSSATTSTK